MRKEQHVVARAPCEEEPRPIGPLCVSINYFIFGADSGEAQCYVQVSSKLSVLYGVQVTAFFLGFIPQKPLVCAEPHREFAPIRGPKCPSKEGEAGKRSAPQHLTHQSPRHPEGISRRVEVYGA